MADRIRSMKIAGVQVRMNLTDALSRIRGYRDSHEESRYIAYRTVKKSAKSLEQRPADKLTDAELRSYLFAAVILQDGENKRSIPFRGSRTSVKDAVLRSVGMTGRAASSGVVRAAVDELVSQMAAEAAEALDNADVQIYRSRINVPILFDKSMADNVRMSNAKSIIRNALMGDAGCMSVDELVQLYDECLARTILGT